MSTDPGQQALISTRPRVSIDGEVRAGVAEAVLAAEVRLPLAGMAHAELRLVNWGTPPAGDGADFQFQDIRLGSRLEILMSEQSDTPVFRGEITAIEERYGYGAPQLVLLAEDALHRLARERHSRPFEDRSIDEVARALAEEAGLECDASVSTLTGTWHQLNESNLAFLLRLTAPHDIAPRLEDGRLRVRDEAPDGHPEPLDPGYNVERARLIADLARQPRRVRVRGYSLADDSELDARGEALSPAPAGTTAADVLARLGWAGESVLPHPAPRSQAEADALAERGFRHRAKRFVHGELLCRGIAGLHSGREIELTGVSPRLAGRYRVVDCSHRFDSAAGFRTRIKVNRPDWDT